MEKNEKFFKKIINLFVELNIEFRLGSAGGGNQTRQPYLKNIINEEINLPQTDHVHFFGAYIGNFPELEASKIDFLVKKINEL